MYLDKEGNVLYVGKAKDLKSRVSSYFVKSANLGEKTKALVEKIDRISITTVESEIEALLLEAFYIKKYLPKYNIRLTDNKSYVRIRITTKDDYPKVLLARQEDNADSIYYGPFPSSSAVKLVLKTIRRVFPFVSVRNHPKRICLYNHLGLCPCPPMFDSPELKKAYRKNINGIIRLLEGQSKKIMTELEKDRNAASHNEDFERALVLQQKIQALSLITTPYRKPFEYDTNPNLYEDKRQEEVTSLLKALQSQGLPVTKLDRIECYDMSNTQGTHAVGSMVVFTNGEKDSSHYRKFRIRREWEKPLSKDEKVSLSPKGLKHLANDFEMMKEVLKRRLAHDEWDMPDLIIVDGGKGQVSKAMEAMAASGLAIPLVGLAKREETIVIPKLPTLGEGASDSEIVSNVHSYRELLNLRFAGNKDEKNKTIIVHEDNFIEISLPKNSRASFLIQRLRNEAHRFAITYHRKLRSKAQLKK